MSQFLIKKHEELHFNTIFFSLAIGVIDGIFDIQRVIQRIRLILLLGLYLTV